MGQHAGARLRAGASRALPRLRAARRLPRPAAEIQWFLYGLRQVFPEAWRRFAGMLPAAERGDLLGGYLKRLFDADPRGSTCRLPAPGANTRPAARPCCRTRSWPGIHTDESIGLARLEAHYFAHECFLAAEQLLTGLHRIRHLPASIVHGRYDMICPTASADELARAWSGALRGRGRWRPLGVGAAAAGCRRPRGRILQADAGLRRPRCYGQVPRSPAPSDRPLIAAAPAIAGRPKGAAVPRPD
jgi:pimeloyl-ACP methyl ester carboxylesterase